MAKTALITRITGQDRSLVAHFLSKRYEDHCIIKRTCTFGTARIDDCLDPHSSSDGLFLHYGDLSSFGQFPNFFYITQSKGAYHLDTRNHDRVIFDTPEDSRDEIGLGTPRILAAIERNLDSSTFPQTSTSELLRNASSSQFRRYSLLSSKALLCRYTPR